MIIDTHCHLTLTKHLSVEAHLRRARLSGIDTILDPGLCLADLELRYQQLKPYLGISTENISPANQGKTEFPRVLLGLGVAPHYLAKPDRSDVGSSNAMIKVSEDINELRHQLEDILKTKQYPVVALSEIGLDYFHMVRTKTEQHELLAMQLGLAKEYDLPVFLHIRDAYQDTYEIVKSSGHTRGAVHCFTGNRSDAEKFLSCGFHLSFSGIVTFKKSVEQREVVKNMSLDKILSETDAPYLSPEPLRGERNESAHIVHTNACIASAIGKSVDKTNDLLAENAKKLLGIVDDL